MTVDAMSIAGMITIAVKCDNWEASDINVSICKKCNHTNTKSIHKNTKINI